MRIAGRWQITETELRDSDDLNLVAPASIEFADDGWAVRLHHRPRQLDCREVEPDERPGVEFSWAGNDDCDPVSGRGWTVLEVDGSLRGRIYFHLADDSGFTAVREGRHGPVGTRSRCRPLR